MCPLYEVLALALMITEILQSPWKGSCNTSMSLAVQMN